MKTILAVTFKDNTTPQVREQIGKTIVANLHGTDGVARVTENKNNTTTLTYTAVRPSSDFEETGEKLEDLTDELHIALFSRLRRKLTGLKGLVDLKIWYSYEEIQVRTSLVLRFK